MCTAGTDYLSIAEAAGYLETTETRILMMLKKQELTGKQEDGLWQIDKASLQLCGKPHPSDIVKKAVVVDVAAVVAGTDRRHNGHRQGTGPEIQIPKIH